jgi:multidrug efflux pump subunit AcrA (membrane-fusion protein)
VSGRQRARRLIAVAVVGILVVAAGVAWSAFHQTGGQRELPLATARKGEFVVIIRCRGDVKASRSVPIYAPIVPNLTIAWMAPEGEEVKEGEPIVRFDSSSAQQQLTQKEAALKQAQASLDQAIAQSRITADHDRSELQDAKYAVEKAQLNTAGSEFVGRIQAKQAEIDLSVAEQKQRVQEANVALNAATDKSRIASLTRQVQMAEADVNLTKARITQMDIRAPLTGFVVFASNNNQGPVNAQPFKVGDNVYSGMNLAEMPDMASLVMDAKVEEIDRGRIGPGNAVRVRIDALPELNINTTLQTISPLTELSGEWPPTRSFRAYAALRAQDPRVRPGMNGGLDIVVKRIPEAISIPAKAVFTRAGRPIVYVGSGGRYTAIDVQVLAKNPDEVAVSGIEAGAVVALVDPEKADATQ